MRSENRHWLAYFISGVVLLGLAFYMVSSIFNHANAASDPVPRLLQERTKPSVLTPQQVPLNAVPVSPLSLPPQPVSTATTAASEQPSVVPAVHEEIKTHTYETTAFYLNVREEPYPKSKILNVLAQGTIVEVLLTTDNGWLKLKDGGYVHGGYARQLKDDVVKIASLSAQDQAQVQAQASSTPAKSEESNGEPRKPTSSVKSASGLSEADIADILEDTDLADQGLEEAILDIESEYGINAYFTIAVMKLESGNGESRLAKRKNNLFGLNAIAGDAFNKALSFETKADCVEMFGQLIAEKYVDRGYTTVEKIAKKYCPANSKWPSHVKNIMAKDYRSL